MNKRNRIVLAAALCLATLTGIATSSSSTPPAERNGEYYVDKLKEAMTKTFEENQELFNQNADGTVKSKDLEPKELYKAAYKEFKKIAGKDFKLSALKRETDPEKIAPALAAMLQGGRITVAKAQSDINGEADDAVVLKKFIPAVFGRLTAERYERLTGVKLKQTTLGKGDYGARNEYNRPTDWEKTALRQFMQKGWELNQGIGDWAENEYRFVKPIYIKKGCLGCHGVPIGEKGPYGHAKEGYEVGDIRGGLSVVIPKGD
jgi:hypothetical protein